MKDETMSKEIWYDCWLTVTVCMKEKTAEEIGDIDNWLRKTASVAIHPWHVCDDRDLVEASTSSQSQEGENIFCLTLTSRHFDFFHGEFEDGNAIIDKLKTQLRYQLLGRCFFVEAEIKGYKKDRISDIFAYFEVEYDDSNNVIREKEWDATVQKYIESTGWTPHPRDNTEEGTKRHDT